MAVLWALGPVKVCKYNLREFVYLTQSWPAARVEGAARQAFPESFQTRHAAHDSELYLKTGPPFLCAGVGIAWDHSSFIPQLLLSRIKSKFDAMKVFTTFIFAPRK